jgi:internalin A
MRRLMLLEFGVSTWAILASAVWVRADENEDKAVAFVKKLGGTVTRDESLPGEPVVNVDLSRSAEMTDSGLLELTAFKRLASLSLHSTKVTDAGLDALAELKNLTLLDLGRTKVTDVGLRELSPLKNLTVLRLQGTNVTDVGLKDLVLRHTMILG